MTDRKLAVAGPETPDSGWMGDRKRGASLGRPSRSYQGDNDTFASKIRLRRVRLDSGGYDQGGAYWGGGTPLYYYYQDQGDVDGYLRARDREHAKTLIRMTYPSVWFYR